MDYNPQTGWLTWRRRRQPNIEAGARAGWGHHKGYRGITINGKNYSEHRLIWYWMTGENPLLEVDHVDGDRANNRWSNLRLATGVQNAANSRYRKRTNQTGLLGVAVVRYKSGIFYRAQITHDRNHRVFGKFLTPEEAHSAYVEEARKLRGDYYCDFNSTL